MPMGTEELAAKAYIHLGRARERLRPWDSSEPGAAQAHHEINEAMELLSRLTRPSVISVMLERERAVLAA